MAELPSPIPRLWARWLWVVPFLATLLTGCTVSTVQPPLSEPQGNRVSDRPEPTVSAQPASAPPSLTAYTVPERMNARRGPGTAHPVVAVLEEGTPVALLARSENDEGTWVQAQVEGMEEPVWLAAWLLRLPVPDAHSVLPSVTPTPAPTPTPLVVDTSEGPVAVTRPERMNVRLGPGTEYPVVRVVPQGTQARIQALGPREQWLQVRLDGLDGPAWLYRELTAVYGSLDRLPILGEDEIPPRPTPTPSPVQAAAALAPTGPLVGYGFAYGIQAHLLHVDQQGRLLDLVRELEFTWVKQQVEWRLFEPNPGQMDLAPLWRIVNEAGARGISVLFSVVNAPDWAREPGFDPSVNGPPGDPQALADFLGVLAREFCGTALRAIEVWNEPNLHYEWGNRPLDPAEYMALLRASYRSIKASCPSMAVISGAPSPTGDNPPLARDDFAYLEGMLQNGLARYADGVGAHPHGFNVPPQVGWQEACAAIQQTGNRFNGPCDNPHHSWSFRSTMEGYRELMVRYGAGHLRIWPTEFGWAAGGALHPAYTYADDNDLDEQARWTVEAFQMMRDWGWVGPAFLWNLNFRVIANGTEKAQWGIIDANWNPLPVFYALRDMPK